MAKVIVCCNTKDGTGKMTLAHLSACLASHFHKKALVVDLKPQGSFAARVGINPQNIKNTSFRWLINTNPPIEKHIINLRQNLDFIPNALKSGMAIQIAVIRDHERFLDLPLEKMERGIRVTKEKTANHPNRLNYFARETLDLAAPSNSQKHSQRTTYKRSLMAFVTFTPGQRGAGSLICR